MIEVWKDIPGFEGSYQASTLGRIKNILTQDVYPMMRRPTKGYRAVGLKRGNKFHIRRIHRIVLETFVGPRPKNKEAAHLDGNKQNNKLSNLSWVSPRENTHHKFSHGTMLMGESHTLARLTNSDVKKIRALYKKGVLQRVIAKRFGVCQTQISRIIIGTRWKHI